MRITVAVVIGFALLSACAPAPQAGGQIQNIKRDVVANFGYNVGKEIRGRYDPAIFKRDNVDGHIRRACNRDMLERVIHTPSGGVVTFVARCRLGTLPEAKGRWVVRKTADGFERAQRES